MNEEDCEHGFQVVSFDPGGTTGWAVISVHPDAVGPDPEVHIVGEYGNVLWWTAGEFTGKQDDQADAMVSLCEEWPEAHLVTENFKLRQLNAELSPVELNAILRHRLRPRVVAKQHAGLAMGTVPDERQKAWGLWVPGKPHARDALKHGITYLKRLKEHTVRGSK
jgi:hypothetical protein